MDNIYKDIIVYKGRVGKLIEIRRGGNALAGNGKVIYKFYPAGYGSYYEEELATIENPEAEVKLANSDEGREYAFSEFRRFRKVDDYVAISNRYQIIKGEDGLYYPHIKYKSISRAFHSLESALVGMIVHDKTIDDDLHLNKYIFKLLDMEW